MSARRSRTRHVLRASAEADGRALALYALNSAAQGCRRSLAPYALRSLAPQIPAVDPSLLPTWPPSQSTRDQVVILHLQRLLGPSPYIQRYSAVPEPEATRVAAAIESEAFAAVSQSVSGVTLASDVERFDVFRTYCYENCSRLMEFFKSRAAATLGAVREPGESSATALPLAASASEE